MCATLLPLQFHSNENLMNMKILQFCGSDTKKIILKIFFKTVL